MKEIRGAEIMRENQHAYLSIFKLDRNNLLFRSKKKPNWDTDCGHMERER